MFSYVRSYLGSSGGDRSLLGQLPKVISLSIMACKYSKARLEGRALEHSLSCQGGRSIRMFSGTKWHYISTKEAADIRRFMKTRVDELWEDLSCFGLTRQRADCAIASDCEQHSVDLVLWSADSKDEILVECKWTRQSISIAMLEAQKSWRWMRPALKGNGRWSASRKPIKAEAMGAMVITPHAWKLIVKGYDGWEKTYPQARYFWQSKRSGRSNWEKWRGGRDPGTPFWWPSGKRRKHA